MRKSLICLGILLSLSAPVFAAQIPDNVRNFVSNDYPKTNFRFDGVIILPDNTLYLPLFPARIVNTDKLEIKATYPANKTLASKPNVVIFNNDFVLLKVLTDTHGNKTIYKMANPPVLII